MFEFSNLRGLITMSDKKGEAVKPSPNIRLKPGASPVTILGKVNYGDVKQGIKLPAGRFQRTGWYEKRAAELVSLYPDRYELITVKGGK